MDPTLALWIARGLELYFLAGLLFAVPFVARGVQRIDPVAAGGTLGFRLLLLPGAALFWPFLLGRWIRRAGPPTESNAHRVAASSSLASDRSETP